MIGWLHPSAKGLCFTGCEHKSLEVEVNRIMPWIYRALFFIEAPAFLGVMQSCILWAEWPGQLEILLSHNENYGSINREGENPGREVNTSPGICPGGLAPRQVEPTQTQGMWSQQLPLPPSVARLL